jgi:ABC-type multidrug transport system ATPase subunit
MPLRPVPTMAIGGSGVSHAGTPILQVRDLRTSLLKPASLSLSAGECIAVRGPSGAGKTYKGPTRSKRIAAGAPSERGKAELLRYRFPAIKSRTNCSAVSRTNSSVISSSL